MSNPLFDNKALSRPTMAMSNTHDTGDASPMENELSIAVLHVFQPVDDSWSALDECSTLCKGLASRNKDLLPLKSSRISACSRNQYRSLGLWYCGVVLFSCWNLWRSRHELGQKDTCQRLHAFRAEILRS